MHAAFRPFLGLAFLPLAACAAIDGVPQPVMTVQRTDAMVAKYRPDDAIVAMGNIAASDTGARNTYRNRVIAAYLFAIDARYFEFQRDLSRAGKSTHLGFDALSLALTGAGSIFDKAASELAAIATATGGARASFDRELFADKTLPILISLMDSRRLKVRADIVRGMSQPEAGYTLEEGFADLMRYEAAGTIDGALSDAAKAAGREADEAEYDFSKAKDLCVVDANTDTSRRTLMLELEKFERDAQADANVAVAKRKAIQDAAKALGIDAPNPPTDPKSALDMLALVRNQLELQCNSSAVDAFRAKLKAGGVPLS
jgi:hypothetical protein